MESHTKIVELFGVPACGKTTLANYLCSKYINDNVATSHESWKEIKMSSPFKKILSFHVKPLYDCYRLCNFFPQTEKRKDMSLWITLFNTYIRCFQSTYSKYNIILNDSSLIQQVVSWERGENFHDNLDFCVRVNNYLQNFPTCIHVYCMIDVDTAIERIKRRGRKSGRLDEILIADPKKLISEYRAEISRFDAITSLIESNGKKIVRLNMDKPVRIIAEDLYNYLR